MVEDAIAAKLKTVSALGNRVTPVVGEKGSTFPFAVYRQTREEQKRSLAGGVGLHEADYTVSILAKSYTEAKSIKELARAAIESMQTNTVSGTYFQKVVIKPDTAEFWDQDVGAFGKEINFTITY